MRAMTVGLAIALLSVACSGGTTGVEVPEGYALYESDTLRFAYPEDWEDQGDTGLDGLEVEIRGARGPGTLGVGVAAYRSPGLGPISLDDWGETYNIETALTLPGHKVRSEEPFSLADGTEALRYEVTYESRIPGGGPTTIREQLVLARVGGDGLVLRCATEEARYEEFADVCRTVATTFAPAP